jgi:photosystem II reaction center protein PsbP
LRLTYETLAIFAFSVALVTFAIVAIESIIDSHEALASDEKCNADAIDSSLCVLGIPDLDFKDNVFSKVYADAVSNLLLTYKDQVHGFEFDYPVHWDQTLANNTNNTGVAFDLNNLTNAAPSGVAVYTERLQENKTLKQYLNDFIHAEYCCVDNQSLKFNESKLGGIASMNASWNHVDENKTIIGKNWLNFAIKDGMAYVIYYHTPTEQSFDKFLPEVKSIVSSFKLSGNLSKIPESI